LAQLKTLGLLKKNPPAPISDEFTLFYLLLTCDMAEDREAQEALDAQMAADLMRSFELEDAREQEQRRQQQPARPAPVPVANNDPVDVRVTVIDKHCKQIKLQTVRVCPSITPAELNRLVLPDNPHVHCFNVGSNLTVYEYAKDKSIRGQTAVLMDRFMMAELTQEEIEYLAQPALTANRVWVRRYAPLGQTHWRSAGLPFPMIVRQGEDVRAFHQRLCTRLGYDEKQSSAVTLGVLTQTTHTPVSTGDDDAQKQPFELIKNDFKGIWTCLGVYDRSLPISPLDTDARVLPQDDFARVYTSLANLDPNARSIAKDLLDRDVGLHSTMDGMFQESASAAAAAAASSASSASASSSSSFSSSSSSSSASSMDCNEKDESTCCRLCLDARPDTVTTCCAMLRICDSCMHKVLAQQSQGAMMASCPNCHRATHQDQLFGPSRTIRVKF
jgi:hypothetical protein